MRFIDFPRISVFSPGCEFYNIFYSMPIFPTDSNLSSYYRKDKGMRTKSIFLRIN